MTQPEPCGSRGYDNPRQRYSTGRYAIQCRECGLKAKRKSRRNKADPLARLQRAVADAKQALEDLKRVTV
jgi:hypothetical protein